METPAQKVEQLLKELLAKFNKTPYRLPVAIALMAGINYLVLVYVSGFCFSSMIVPLSMLGIFWLFNYRRVKKLLLYGAVACMALSGVSVWLIVDSFQSVEPISATSSDGELLTNGTLEPLLGDETTLFNFTIQVNLPSSTSEVSSPNLLLYGLRFSDSKTDNVTMTLLSRDDENFTETYYYETTREDPINLHIFLFLIDGNWTEAGYVDENGRMNWIEGPIYDDPGKLAVLALPFGFYSTYLYTFGTYAVLCAMIWWIRRARRMRTDAIERMEAERAKMKAEQPKEESAKVAKTPSLAQAMGLEKEETFVCSECGADVPADATACPKCGEKFD
jgi:ribosomal protein L40E